jgi:hypothetical protein
VRRWVLIVALAAAALAVGAAPALAVSQTRYVSPSGSDGSGDVENNCLEPQFACLTIQHAADEANADDTISLAAGTYTQGATLAIPVTFVAAPGTFIDTTASGEPALTTSANLSLRGIRLRGGGGEPALFIRSGSPVVTLDEVVAEQAVSGIEGDGTIEAEPATAPEIVVEGSTVSGEGYGAIVTAHAGSLSVSHSTVTDSEPGQAAILGEGANVTATDSTLAGRDGVFDSGGTALLTRDLIHGTEGGVVVQGVKATLRDSLVAPPTGGTLKYAFAVDGHQQGEATIVGSTLYARSPVTNPAAVPAAILIEAGSAAVPVRVSNSILRAIDTDGDGADDIFVTEGTSGVVWSVSHTSFTSSAGPGVPAPGGPTDVVVAPAFAGAASGDFHLTETDAALIDAGDAAQVMPGETDLGGGPRAIDGNCDGVAVPDLGAYELTRAPCPPPAGGGGGGGGGAGETHLGPTVTELSVKHTHAGTVLHFTLSEPATVKLTFERAHAHKVKGKKKMTFSAAGSLTDKAKAAGPQTVALSGKGATDPLAPGAYRLTLVATDSSGATSPKQTLGFSVPAPPRRHHHRHSV